MKFTKILGFITMLSLFLWMAGCGGGGGDGGSAGGGNTGSVTAAPTPTLVSIAVTPPNSSLVVGTAGQFTATGSFSDNSTQDLTSSVTWSSSVNAVATVSNDAGSKGKVTAVAAGNTTITAILGNVTGFTSLTSTGVAEIPAPPPTLVSISVTPANSSLVVGATGQFTATGTFSDNSTQNLTSSVAWNSSGNAVATVSNDAGSKGTVTAVSGGTATITASLGTVVGSTSVILTDPARPENVMAITVNGPLCSPSSYLNKPCVSVTVCNPDLSVCQTVNDILLDTGSYGLRIFQQAIPNLTLPQVASGTGSLTGCVQFADGTSLWGPIKRAAVILGTEPAVQVPVQVVDAAFGSLPQPCANADPSPLSAGFAGILGVGSLIEDCGPACVIIAESSVYYRCTGTSCVGTTVPLADQVQNPVARLPQDNNGLLVQFPSVPAGGVSSLDGSVILGIGTRSNNAPASPTVFRTDANADIMTIFSGVPTVGFFDTGSNGLFFPSADAGALPVCAPPNSDWYCPPATTLLLATNVGVPPPPSQSVSFNVSNFLLLANSPNNVFSEVGGPSTFGFDWGLPFFMGRSVFFGIEGKPSTLGTGPYVAY